MGEFDLIARYFKRKPAKAVLGIGDDCALLMPSPGMQMAISTDMLVEGRHFFPYANPQRLGHKSLAVNLSDLAACGAKPLAFALALSLPKIDEEWLAGFSEGLFALADEHGCELIGGDTTQGPLNICITVFGEVPIGKALLRSGAKLADDIYVSGTLGDARLALEAARGAVGLTPQLREQAQLRMDRPTPRVKLGMALRGVATSAIDISDGLAGDLGHVLRASGVGARIESTPLLSTFAAATHMDLSQAMFNAHALDFTFAGGDDYEIAFTAPRTSRIAVKAAAIEAQTMVTRIGEITSTGQLELVDAQGQRIERSFKSFDHFA